MRHGSLFSGIGAAEIAAEMLGWGNVFHCEINPFGRAVLDYWFPNSESYEDITKTDFAKYRGQIDVLTGGFPCQPFSYAGKREGQSDDRYLWPEMLRVIDEVRPTWVIGENVAGITTMVESLDIVEMGSESSLFQEGDGVHRYRAEQTFTIERVCSDLERIGYSVQPMLIPAAAVGALHRRDRIFIIAFRTESSEDSVRHGCLFGSQEEQGGERNFRNIGARNLKRFCGEERVDASDTGSKGLEERMSAGLCENTAKERARLDNRTERFSINGRVAGMLPGERWSAFPSVSAVHRGNDGLPFDVDSLAIPFSKWRTESLKAYGNAIVPQVMYRIFEAIEAIETLKDYGK